MASEIKVDTIVNAGGDNDSGIDLATNDVVAVKTANTERMRVDASGNVGIGTTPSQALHVSASNPFLELQGTATTSGDTGIFLNANANHWILKADNYSSTNAFQIKQGDTSSSTAFMTIDSIGAVTKPLQPACLVRAAANSNFAVNTTHTVNYTTEVYDQNGDFSTTDNQFTAPVTGRYLINQSLYYNNVVSNATYLSAFIYTSNRTYVSIINPAAFDQDSGYHTLNISVVADLDANDVVQSRYYQAGGSATTDLVAETFLSVCLLA